MMMDQKRICEHFVEFVSALNLVKGQKWIRSQISGFSSVCSEETADPCLAPSCMRMLRVLGGGELKLFVWICEDLAVCYSGIVALLGFIISLIRKWLWINLNVC